MKVTVEIPDIGDFADVPVIEIGVAVGDHVAKDDPILMLESDKATMDIPAPVAGEVTAIHVAVGDRVGRGSLVMTVETEDAKGVAPDVARSPATMAVVPAREDGSADIHADLVVLGGGPGGYTAAFRAADLGREVVLVERGATLGGVCLNVGCIPSKALLHAAKVIDEAAAMAAHGVRFGAPQIDLDALRTWKEGVVDRLTTGLAGLARKRQVTVLQGAGRFDGPNRLMVRSDDGARTLTFDQAVIACGSEPARPSFLPDDPRVIDSTGALALADIPERLLVLGGGIIGLEMAEVYAALGATITIAEMMDQIVPGADRDLVMPLMRRIERRYETILLRTKVSAVTPASDGLHVAFEGPDGNHRAIFDKMLVAVGRRPNGTLIGAAAAGLAVDAAGFIAVDRQMRTSQPHIFAVGDVVGPPMLAHKAVHEGKVAAEAACGHKASFDAAAIPSVAYTDPEIAWVGLTEMEAKATGRAVKKAVFPWAASGRSLSLGRDDGLTKLLFDPDTRRLVGAGVVGPGAGELLAEAVLAIEMGADAEDIGLTIHPHPTLSETIGLAAEVFEGTVTDL